MRLDNRNTRSRSVPSTSTPRTLIQAFCSSVIPPKNLARYFIPRNRFVNTANILFFFFLSSKREPVFSSDRPQNPLARLNAESYILLRVITASSERFPTNRERSFPGRYRSGQTGQTVNLLAYAFSGSNPLLPMPSSTVSVGVALVASYPLPGILTRLWGGGVA